MAGGFLSGAIGIFSRFAPTKPLSQEQNKKLGSGALTPAEKHQVSLVGIATPGTNKGARALDIGATSTLSQRGRFADIPSSGGFTVLGRNILGQEVARDNTTGNVATIGGVRPVSPAARALGETKSAKATARANNTRRNTAEKASRKRKTSSILNLNEESILGNQSILG